MGFPENVLTKDEKVVRNLHPHVLTVLRPAAVGLLLLLVGVGVANLTSPDLDLVQWVVVGLVLVLAVFFVLVPFLRWRTTSYVLTTHRVMVRSGVLNTFGKDITLSKITDVSYRQNVLERIAKSGTLLIESAGDSPNELLRNIPNSVEVQQLINGLIDEDANRRGAVMQERMYREHDVFDQTRDDRRPPLTQAPSPPAVPAPATPPSTPHRPTTRPATPPATSDPPTSA